MRAFFTGDNMTEDFAAAKSMTERYAEAERMIELSPVKNAGV